MNPLIQYYHQNLVLENCSKEDSYDHLKKHETIPDSKDTQNKVTEQLRSFDSLKILQEDDRETKSNIKGLNSD